MNIFKVPSTWLYSLRKLKFAESSTESTKVHDIQGLFGRARVSLPLSAAWGRVAGLAPATTAWRMRHEAQLDPGSAKRNLVSSVIINVLGWCYLFQELNINNNA